MPAIDRIYREAVSGAVWLPPAARSRADFASVSGGEVVYVATIGSGEPSGFVSVYTPESFIHHLFVAPPFQRRGLASALLDSLQGGLPLPWRLKCVRANTHALAFYAAQGWRAVGADVGVDGPYLILEFDRASPAS